MARIKLRRDTLANWDAANPVLDLGEPGYVTDTEQLKIGNGVDNWDALPYFFGGFDGGTIANALTITANGEATTGSLNLLGECYDNPGSSGLLRVGEQLNFQDSHLLATFVKNMDDYIQVIISNKSDGPNASSDFVANNDSTFGPNIYGNFGINSTGFVGTGGPFDRPNETYVIAAGGELALGTIDPYTVSLVTNDVSRIEIANNGEVEFQPSAPVHILSTTDSIDHETGALVIEGGLGVGKTIVCDDNIFVGQGAVSVPLTDPVFAAKQPGTDFIQVALVNSLPTGSSDFIAYGSSSTESQGWTSVGFTGPSFVDPLYPITEPGEGYVFVQGTPSSHGSLVLATGNLGTDRDIVFATGGFTEANERMRLEHTNQSLHIYMETESTNTMTGAVVLHGGIGVDKNISVGGAINNVEITPPASTATLTLGSSVTLDHPRSLTFPNSAGTAGAVLTTNGSGTLSYTTQADIAVTKLPIVNISGTNHVATVTNNVICIDPTGSPRTVTLPDDAPQGKIYTIKKTTSASTVTVDTSNVFCTIDGAGSYTLNNLEAVTVVMGNDGANDVYYIIGKVV